MVKDHSDSERENRCRHIGYSFPGFFYMHHPIERMIHTTAFVTPVMEHWLEREIAQWVYDKEGTNFKYAFINVPHHYQQHIHYLVLVLYLQKSSVFEIQIIWRQPIFRDCKIISSGLFKLQQNKSNLLTTDV